MLKSPTHEGFEKIDTYFEEFFLIF